MKSIPTLVCCCTLLLALGAVAVQNPTTPPPSGQPQTAPPPSQPQAAPPSGQQEPPPQGTARSMQPPTIDDQVRALTQELSLTGEQPAKVKTMLEDQRQQAMTIVNDGSISREDKILKLQTLREGTIAKVRGILSDDQKKKLDQMLQVDEEQQPPRREQQSNPPPTPK